ncbi:WbuC family cupin fold metalloprotein [Rheinheimera texasensis]|jgi:cupin fold WbuC family metalloprotein|uniref:WbuC family cupin fold metalloprotein n=1 Tax=Rheinheimera texasensis TaxID=306205 RepID=UPI0004E20517|nr:WbuC family cupin fold metalloprotein [Rheinheimera texasensis]
MLEFAGMLLDHSLFSALLDAAAQSPRRRAFKNLHQDFAEAVQRVVIAIQPDSYVPPHRHVEAHQWELFVVLAGSIDFCQFDDAGQLISRSTIVAGSTLAGLELAPGIWHSIVAAPGGAVFLEVKQGPFDPAQPRYFAPFAPTEQDLQAGAYLAWLRTALPGDQSPAWQEMKQ